MDFFFLEELWSIRADEASIFIFFCLVKEMLDSIFLSSPSNLLKVQISQLHIWTLLVVNV